MSGRPPSSTLFPYTTLFRSKRERLHQIVVGAQIEAEDSILDRVASGQHEYGRLETSLSEGLQEDRKSTRLNSSHANISYAVFCLKKKIKVEGDEALALRDGK